MLRFAGVFVLLLSFCLPCRAETFADMWNGSGLAEYCFYLGAGWMGPEVSAAPERMICAGL